MRPVDQTTFGFPGGNCFSACVASLLEVPLEDVPQFMGDTLDDDSTWYERFREWLAPRSLYPLCLKLGSEWVPPGFHILSGRSPRHATALHSVIALDARVVHDPHPSRAGLATRDDVIVLIPMDPAHAARHL
jgi:hypothetical protein